MAFGGMLALRNEVMKAAGSIVGGAMILKADELVTGLGALLP